MVAQGYAALGQLYVTVGDLDLALEAFRQAARLEPRQPIWQVQVRYSLASNRRPGVGRPQFRLAAQSGFSAADNQTGPVEIEIQRQIQKPADKRDWAPAKQLVQTLRQKGTSEVTVGLMAAKILAASNDMDKAEKTIVKLTEQYPNDASVWRLICGVALPARQYSCRDGKRPTGSSRSRS